MATMYKPIIMPDITMCTNEECSLKETCVRWLSIPNEFHQSYSKFETIIDEEIELCSYYIDIDNLRE